MTPKATRPVDLDTGFWLWMAALPLMVVGYVIDMLTAERGLPAPVLVLNVVFLVVLVAVVVTFLILMRQGYRWTRTCLTGGAIAAVAFTVSSLFTIERPTGAAVGFAVSAIFGSVLIAGGVFLLHRRDVNDFFTGDPPVGSSG
ncbi:MAG: hypothetical protein AB7G47_00585 [Mycolicibacterium sp.]|uniref:hypothetical protein n=1 Tax=Mycolicibacterium sp. TaxID=2320850 RepID=UPI003D105978